MSSPQWRPQKSKKDRKLLRRKHLERADCALTGNDCSGAIELHHVLGGKYGREDHESNLIPLCYEHHHRITTNDVEARIELGVYVITFRMDVVTYVRDRLGSVSGDDWLRRRLFIEF